MNCNTTGGWKCLIVCDGTSADPCTFQSLIKLFNALINDLILLSTLLTVIMCIVIGFRLITSQGSESAMKDAKDKATKLLIGYVVILTAWLIVHTITSVLLNNGYSFV